MSTVPMIFNDGTQAYVPQEKVLDATRDGGEVAHHVKFDDGTEGIVPHAKLADAMKDGGTLAPSPMDVPKMQPQDPSLGDVASIAGTAASVMAPEAMGMAGGAIKAARAAKIAKIGSDVAEDAGPKAKAIWPLVQKALSIGEIKGAEAEAGAYQSLKDALYEAQAEATHAGKATHAAYYGTVAAAAKVMEKASAAWAATGGKIPLLPAALTVWNAYETGHQIHGMFKNDEDQ